MAKSNNAPEKATAEEIKAAAERTAVANAAEAEKAKAEKAAAAIEAQAKKAAAAEAKAAAASETKVTVVSHGGNGFLVTETGADGSINQYHSETDPTKK